MAKVRATARVRACCVLLPLFLAACGEGPSAAPEGPSGAYYIDCRASAPGEGSITAPWNDFDGANATTLGAGDQILLRRGTVCSGMLKPRGSGSAEQPIVIGPYGDGPLPRIDANGTNTAALHIEDMSYVRVHDLELTNAGNTSEPHRGLYLTAVNTLVRNIEITNLFVHDVDGSVGFNGTDKSGGGIIGKVQGGLPARFDGVLIENNRIEDVGRSGIWVTGTAAKARPRATALWPEGSTGLVVRANVLERLQGDAIVAYGTVGAVIEDNVVRIGNLAGKNWARPDRNCSAGIWTYKANNTLIQRNEVSGYVFGQSATDGCDGTGFDVDDDQDGTIIQFNYSHDNEGGFILMCSDDQPRTVDVRYNLSVDDGHSINAVPCKTGSFDGIRFFNNTFVAANPNTSLESIAIATLNNPGTFQFANNILYGTSAEANVFACGNHCSHNLFFNLPPAGTAFVTGDPRFEDASRRGSGRLLTGSAFRIAPGSAAIVAGLGLEDAPAADYFGNVIPAMPAIGFHQPRQRPAGS